MYVLFETPAGFALFKVLKDEKKLKDADKLAADFETPDGASKVVKLAEGFQEVQGHQRRYEVS
jgi:nucleolar protein 58